MEEELDIFELLDSSKEVTPLDKRAKTASTDIEIDTDFGKSTYDEDFYPDAELNKDGTGLDMFELINEKRSEKQPWITKAGAGLGRAATKALTEVAKMPGVIVGGAAGIATGIADAVSGKDEYNSLDMAFNNAWIKGIESINETINEEVLPVYVDKAVKEGNLWDNITDIDFWATEGADGAGFMASMLVPGAVINKFKLGEKLFKGIGKLGTFNEKTLKIADELASYGLPTNPANVDLYSQTIANTIFEAGAEAKSAGDAYLARMENSGLSEEELAKGKSAVMQNVFSANAAILLGPNAVMSKILWGKGGSKILRQDLDRGFKGKAVNLGKDVVSATGREAFLEEGLQSTVEGYYTDKAIEGGSISIGEIAEAYIDNLATTEGQKAIFLGAVMGSGMQAITGKLQRDNERKATKSIMSKLHEVDSFYKIYSDDTYNEDGSINNTALKEKIQALDNSEKISAIYDNALESGNDKLIKATRAHVAGEIVKPFIFNKSLGIEALNEYFTTSKQIQDIAAKEETEVNDIVDPILNRAKKLVKDYTVFEDFSKPLLNLKGGDINTKAIYYDNLASRYISRKNMQYAYENELQSLENKKNNLLESLDAEEDIEDNFAISEVNQDIKDYKSLIDNIKKQNKLFWNKEYQQKQYNSKLKEIEDISKAEEKEEEISEAINQVDNATTEEEVDNVPKTNTIADKNINDKKSAKKEQIKEEKIAQKEEQLNKQKEQSETLKEEKNTTEELKGLTSQWIKDNVNPEETLTITAEISKEYEGEEAVVTQITDDNISLTVFVEGGTVDLVLPINKAVYKVATVEDDYQTEGSENHNLLIPKEEIQKVNDAEAKTGSKIISTTRDGEKFPFVSQAYLDYERTPINKKGKEVGFEVNLNDLGDNDKSQWIAAKNIYKRLLKAESINKPEIDLLINHLPINAVIAEGITSPIETLPSTEASQKIFNLSTRLLRTKIINALVEGKKIEDIKTIIEGQYGGIIQVEEGIPENSILDLYHFNGMTENEKFKYIKDNLGYIKGNGTLELLDGTLMDLNKPNAAGELYLMIPKANGEKFPLKLNIKKINERDSELLYQIYDLRLKEKDLIKSTTLQEIDNKELMKGIKDNFKEELKLINKPIKDITLRDITEFFIYSNVNSPKSSIEFTGTGKQGERALKYGNKNTNGGLDLENVNKDKFKDWLQNNKRYNINIKPNKIQENTVNMQQSDQYIKYLFNNRILNTNAVVDKPTFGGYTNIYLKSDIKSPNTVNREERKAFMDKKIAEGMSALDALNEYTRVNSISEVMDTLESIPNTEESKNLQDKKESITKKDNISKELVMEIFKELQSKNVIKVGKQTKQLLSGSNEENFNKLKVLAEKNNIAIDNIITKCS